MGSAPRYGIFDAFGRIGAGLAWNRPVERRRGPMGSRMLWRRCPGLMPSAASRGWIAKRSRRGCSLQSKGLEGLHDRPKGYSPRRLTADDGAGGGHHRRSLSARGLRLDPGRRAAGGGALPKTYHPSSMTRVRRMGFSRQKAVEPPGGTPCAGAPISSRHPEGRPPRRIPTSACGFGARRCGAGGDCGTRHRLPVPISSTDTGAHVAGLTERPANRWTCFSHGYPGPVQPS